MHPITRSADKLSFQVDGKPWIVRGTRDDVTFGRFVDGEDITPILEDRRSVGANLIRVYTMIDWWASLRPENEKVWQSLIPFGNICSDYGLYVEWGCFADAQVLIPSLAAQQAHWQRFLLTLANTENGLFQLVNQGDKNGVPRDRQQLFPKLPDFPQQLVCLDNPEEEQAVTMPPGDYAAFCNRRDFPKGMLDAGSSLWYSVHDIDGSGQGCQCVTILDEPPHVKPNNEWANPDYWRMIGRSVNAFKGAGGLVMLTDQTQQGKLLTGVERDCVVEVLANLQLP